MAEIIAHPWVTNSDVPTHEQVCEYFQARKLVVDSKAEEALKEDIKKYNEAIS